MSQPSAPSAPNLNKVYEKGIQTYLKYLPQLLGGEQAARTQYDPQRIAEQQALQQVFGPTQYAQQLAALKQLDPLGVAMRNVLGGQIGQNLQRGYTDPQQAGVYRALGTMAQNAIARGGVLNPQQQSAYDLLGRSVTGELGRGYTLGPALGGQVQQAERAAQAARGNIYGNAPASAEALYAGQRGQQLYQQRVGNVQGYLGLQSPQAQAAALGMQFYGLQSPEAGALAQAGGFLGSGGPASPMQQISQIQGVVPDRASAYVNPQAGYLGQQGALSNYGNQLGAASAPNPWMGALSGAASGAAAGSLAGPGYGTLIGAGLGALGGYFSDPKMKTDVKKVGSVPIYEYRYKPRYGVEGTFRGPDGSRRKKTRS